VRWSMWTATRMAVTTSSRGENVRTCTMRAARRKSGAGSKTELWFTLKRVAVT